VKRRPDMIDLSTGDGRAELARLLGLRCTVYDDSGTVSDRALLHLIPKSKAKKTVTIVCGDYLAILSHPNARDEASQGE
jgi:hypothetical protein